MAKKEEKNPAPALGQLYEVAFTAISDGGGGLRRQGEIVPESELRDLPRLLEIGAVRAVPMAASDAALEVPTE